MNVMFENCLPVDKLSRKTHIYICPNGSQINVEISYLEAEDKVILYSTENFRIGYNVHL